MSMESSFATCLLLLASLCSCGDNEQEVADKQKEFELTQARFKQEADAEKAAYDKLNNSISNKLISFRHKNIRNTIYLGGKESIYEAVVAVTNNTDKAVRAYTSNIRFYDLVGDNSIVPIYTLDMIDNDLIKPGTTIKSVILLKYNNVSKRDWEAMELITERGITNLDIKYSYTEILFADGERLK